jgi:hypothetical protein
MKNIRTPWLRYGFMLIISWGLFWFSQDFAAGRILEPESIGWKLWFCYAKDLMQPFALYLLLCLGEKWLTTWRVLAAVAFSFPFLLELFQFLYYRIAPTHYVGSFDPLDILMYAIGISMAVIVEQIVLTKFLQPNFI